MKALIISFCIFILIITIWFLVLSHMDQTLHELIDLIENNLEPTISQGDWDKSEEIFLVLKEKWQQHQSLYSLFIDEASLMEITYANSKIDTYIQYQAYILALSELSYVKEHLKTLHANESVSWENVL